MGTLLGTGLVVVMAIGMVGLVLLLRDEQRARRSARDEKPDGRRAVD